MDYQTNNQNNSDGGFSYSPNGDNSYYNQPVRNENGMEKAAYICTIIGIISSLMGLSILAFIPAGLGILFALLSKGKFEKCDKRKKNLIIICVIVIVIASLYTIYMLYAAFSNPSFMQQIDDMCQQLYGTSFSEFLQQ